MRARWLLPAALLMVAPLATSATSSPLTSTPSESWRAQKPAVATGPHGPLHIVQLRSDPVAIYSGGVGGLAATSPDSTRATKLDVTSPSAQAYGQYLRAEQTSFLSDVAASLGRSVHAVERYSFVLNGVAIELSRDEAELVARHPSVSSVWRSTSQPLLTDSGPEWIGARDVWSGAATGGAGTMGEGVLVGIVDTGINIDHPSFAAAGPDGFTHTNPFGSGNYKGFCDPMHPLHDPALHVCNDKLVGAWSFPSSGNEPEDDDGHGSHTASTVAGNALDAVILAPTASITQSISGVAPHANIIAYDACNVESCPDAATAAAIDQAVADGVDVINYSIGTARSTIWTTENPVMTAFRNARAAGVFAAVSAGNGGPGEMTTAAVGPWMTAVGAATHNRVTQNSLSKMTGGDTTPPPDIVGKGFTSGHGPAPVVYAAGYLKSDSTPDDGMCLTPFPAGTFAGEIVVCDRGTIARTAKGTNVLAGGAGGLILANTAADGASTVGEGHALPAVHISHADGVVLKAWLASGTDHEGIIKGTQFARSSAFGDITANFSSRGPTRHGVCCLRPIPGFYANRWLDVLKPDVTAPGVDVLAAVGTDPSDPASGPEFGFVSGTSMSSPHTAGAAALLRAAHPTWTVAEAQSALMLTSATSAVLKQDGATPADAFDRGAGRINVAAAAASALVMDMTMSDARAADPLLGGDPSSLNVASLAEFSCLATCGWTRTVKSSATEAITWTVSVTTTSGLALTVMPPVFNLAPGGTQVITVSAGVTGLFVDSYGFGEVRLVADSGAPDAHLPVAVRSVAVDLPMSVISELPPIAVIETSALTGTHTIGGLKSLGAESLSVSPMGLARSTNDVALLIEDPTNGDPYDNAAGTVTVAITVPVEAGRLVAEVYASEAEDVDLFVGRDDNGNGIAEEDEEVCSSTTSSYLEFCDIRDEDLEPGAWWMLVQNWSGSGSGAADSVSFRYGVVSPDTNVGLFGMSAPPSVALGALFDLEMTWDVPTLDTDSVYYGLVHFGPSPDPHWRESVGIDLVALPAPPSIYLPSLPDNPGPLRGDPRGHVIFGEPGNIYPAPGVAMTLYHVPSPANPNCPTADTKIDWKLHANTTEVGATVLTTQLSPNTNPLPTNASGEYAWDVVDTSMLPGCYYVELASGPPFDTFTVNSPLFGLKAPGLPGADVTDLHFCISNRRWGSNRHTLCSEPAPTLSP